MEGKVYSCGFGRYWEKRCDARAYVVVSEERSHRVERSTTSIAVLRIFLHYSLSMNISQNLDWRSILDSKALMVDGLPLRC